MNELWHKYIVHI